ncbi:hypothetical protein AMS68_005809 [Peltaster fructicola]|uniref:Ubiquitin carboxyl-terminal hydrolase n=1 Tax=Peltaster fructicola TaxID=286661 RepID=A0A6H0XZT9_9PEZI|nr:hypothetical protein AMS68_005809 [Peltaster fructicola]
MATDTNPQNVAPTAASTEPTVPGENGTKPAVDLTNDSTGPRDGNAVSERRAAKVAGDGKSIEESASVAGDTVPQNTDAVATSTDTTTRGDAGHSIDLNKWSGWVELESEPAYFNALLGEIGVQGVKVQEILGLDEELVALIPQPCHALIFLFKYIGSDRDESDDEQPDDIWFARQIAPNACATQALMNIIMNIPGLSIGGRLAAFKAVTSDMTPTERGDELDQLHFVRAVHNSFATENDIISADQIYQKQVKTNHKRAANAKADKAKKRKLDEDDTTFEPSKRTRSGSTAAARSQQKSEEVTAASTKPTRPSARAQRQNARRRKAPASEAAYHYCAYMPIGGHLWLLDGLEPSPEDLGAVPAQGTWLDAAIPALGQRMAAYEADDVEFCLMAIVHDPATGPQKQDVGDVNELSNDRSDAERVFHRRHDYASFVRGWMTELAEGDHLEDLMQA